MSGPLYAAESYRLATTSAGSELVSLENTEWCMKRANGAVSNQRQLAAMLLSLLLPRHHTSLLATSPVSGPAAACCSDTEICSRKNKYLQVQTDNVQYRYLDQDQIHGRQLRPLPASLSLKWQSMVAFPPHFIAASIFFWGPVYCLCLDIKILYICTCTICTHRRTQKFSKSVQSADGRWRSQWDLEMEKINRIYVYYLGLGRKSFLL